MVMNGWDYEHTTYVDDKNTRVGDYVDFGKGRTQVGQAYEVAAWLFKQNRAWTDPGKGDWQPGDLLFWSHPDPEGAGTTGVYFANVHHVALYIGDNKVVHSWGVASGAGVVEEPVTDLMRDKVTLVGRPNWFDFTGNADGGSKTPASSAESPSESTSAELSNVASKPAESAPSSTPSDSASASEEGSASALPGGEALASVAATLTSSETPIDLALATAA